MLYKSGHFSAVRMFVLPLYSASFKLRLRGVAIANTRENGGAAVICSFVCLRNMFMNKVRANRVLVSFIRRWLKINRVTSSVLRDA